MKQVKITISKTGAPTIEAQGYKGGECVAATAGLRGRLGGGEGDMELSPEYYEQPEGGQYEGGAR